MAKKSKHGGRPPRSADPRLACLGMFCLGRESNTRYDDVRDVDIIIESGKYPYRTRLCPRCREKVEIVHDRGDANAEM